MDADDRRALERFVALMPTMHEGPPYTKAESQKESPRLTVVTADNAAQFTQAPKRRGRKPKVRAGGNVLAFPCPAPAVPAPPKPLSPLEAQRLRVAALLEARRKDAQPPALQFTAADLPPAPQDDRLRRRANTIAFGGFLTAQSNARRSNDPCPRWECFIAAAWAKLGYAAPPMTAERRAMQLPLPESRP